MSEPSFRLVRFNPRRMLRTGAADVEIIEDGEKYRLWMTEQDIKDNIVMFGRHPGLVAALEAYRNKVEIRLEDTRESAPCAARLWNEGKPSPRTCERCGLGPCEFGEVRKG